MRTSVFYMRENTTTGGNEAQQRLEPGCSCELMDQVNRVLCAAEKDYAGLQYAVSIRNNIDLLDVDEAIREQFRAWRDQLTAAREIAGRTETHEIDCLVIHLNAWINTYL